MRYKYVVPAVLGVVALSSFIGYTATNINKVRVDDKVYDVRHIEDGIKSNLASSKPVFKGKDSDDFNSMINYKVDLAKIRGRSFIKCVSDVYTAKVYRLGKDISCSYTVDKDTLSSRIAEYNKTAKKSEDAKLVRGSKVYSIQKERYGTQIDIVPLVKDLDAKQTGLKIQSYYIKPNIYSTNLKGIKNKLNKFVSWSCKYKNGVTIKSNITAVSYNKGNINLDVDWLRNSLIKNIDKFNTVGKDRKFKTHSGKKITVSGGTWGSIIDADKELQYITKKFKACKSLSNREPYYELHHDKLGKTYVEVSLDKQMVWYYKNGKCKMSSPCVTGNVSLGHGTPRGMYYISERVNGKYLTGDGYKTWVNKWMRITNMGVGLHDAYWRSYFGGSIYRTNGSHGCINLPSDFASKLYKVVHVGMPVIVY